MKSKKRKKRCFYCGEFKGEDDFYKCSRGILGLTAYCKLCRKYLDAQRYYKNRDKIITDRKKYYENGAFLLSPLRKLRMIKWLCVKHHRALHRKYVEVKIG